jgi:FMN phosphatase YigB (HAD superfamily)
MVAGTKAETVIVLLKNPSQTSEWNFRNHLDTGNMGPLLECFPNATRVIDRFHVQKLASEALQEIRIKYRWNYRSENEANEKLKKNKKKFEPYVLTNGDTLKLLAWSRYFLYKTNQNGPKTN